MNRLELSLPKRAYLRIGFSAVPLGLVMFSFVWAWQVASGEGGRWFRPDEHVVGIAGCVIAAIATAVLVFSLRDRGAHVTWDEHGITEWQGKGPRVAIPWAEARLSRILVRVRARGGGTYGDGGLEQWTDARGRTITLASTQRVPDWLLRRRCETTTGAIRPPQPPRPAEGVKPDERGTRHISWLTWPLRLGYVPLLALAAGLIDRPSQARDSAAIAALIITVPLMLRALRPALELAKLMREGSRVRAARLVEIVANEGTVVHARESDGTTVLFDTAPLQHDDALLHTRRGPVWIVAPRALATTSDPSPYRQGTTPAVPIEVDRLEHDGIRAARTALMLAIAIEIAARVTFALIPPLACLAIESAMPPGYY